MPDPPETKGSRPGRNRRHGRRDRRDNKQRSPAPNLRRAPPEESALNAKKHSEERRERNTRPDLTLQVTQEHIRQGTPGSHNKCAIGLTLAEAGFTQVQVHTRGVSYREPDGRLRVLEADGFFHQWVGSFDSPQSSSPAPPCTMYIHLEGRIVRLKTSNPRCTNNLPKRE